MNIEKSLTNLISYIENENFKGYDPYDILNSKIKFKKLGQMFAAILTQIHKRNPINLRPILGIKKEYIPKGMGLLLKAYVSYYQKNHDKKYLQKADEIFEWLENNYSKGFNSMCWGCNFPWANPHKYWEAYSPSVVVTSFIIDGIFDYYQLTKSEKALKTINNSVQYITNNLYITEFNSGKCFSYNHEERDCCYNANLLGAEVLSKHDFLRNTDTYNNIINFRILLKIV